MITPALTGGARPDVARGAAGSLPPGLLDRANLVHRHQPEEDVGRCRRPPRAGGERFLHHARVLVLKAEDMAKLVIQDGKQVHPALLALITGRGKLSIVPRRAIDEPAPAGRVV